MLAGLLKDAKTWENTMTFAKLTVTLAAALAATPALAHPGHAAATGHIHWEFVAAALASAGACGLVFWRRRKAAEQRK